MAGIWSIVDSCAGDFRFQAGGRVLKREKDKPQRKVTSGKKDAGFCPSFSGTFVLSYQKGILVPPSLAHFTSAGLSSELLNHLGGLFVILISQFHMASSLLDGIS